jgi:hypothetical protein
LLSFPLELVVVLAFLIAPPAIVAIRISRRNQVLEVDRHPLSPFCGGRYQIATCHTGDIVAAVPK